MKSEKGITLISVTVYIIVLLLVISMMTVISDYFYKNTNLANKSISFNSEYSKFNTYFSDEINRQNIKILKCEEQYIAFDNGTQYTFVKENKAIYKNNVEICSGIEVCKFSRGIENGKNVVKVEFKIGNKSRTLTYTLKNN